jgi:tripartite-type tricarboxylate transporter receptor subunit TctC
MQAGTGRASRVGDVPFEEQIRHRVYSRAIRFAPCPAYRMTSLSKLGLAACIGAAAFAGSLFAATADAPWPSRPVRIIVAQAPGGPPDLIGRYVAEKLSRNLGAPVIVDNRPGASGIIGIDQAAHATPDGHTLVIATLSTHALVPHVAASVPYDPLRDFVPVSNLFRSIKAVWISAALPAQTLPEFVTYAAARPGQLNFGSGGVGSSNHVDAELFKSAARIDLAHVPYNSPSAAIAAVASGDVQMMIVSITTGLPLAQAGRVRPLVVFSADRSPLLPGVPTAGEAGLKDLDLTAWIGLMAPVGTPGDVVNRINAAVDAVLRSADTIAWARRNGLEIATGSPASFAATVADDHARWGTVIRRMRLPPQ